MASKIFLHSKYKKEIIKVLKCSPRIYPWEYKYKNDYNRFNGLKILKY